MLAQEQMGMKWVWINLGQKLGKVVSNWGNELPPKQEGRKQVSVEDGM